ncbi:MAG: hypothetical protein FIA96_01935 [Betaproteobacteria bacterium]|nr:hypothetical protein [Betaproteobacteria bacterium]
MTFTVREYRLGYAIWAAYRAAQAGSSKAKGPELSEALSKCGVVAYLDNYDGVEIDSDAYKKNHDKWCKNAIDYIKNKYNIDITYGIAAKLIGIFVKGYFILAWNENKPLSKVAHPPIDSYLLKGVDKANGSRLDKEYKWQKLDIDKYYELLNILRGSLEKDEEFWRIEKYWKLR